MIYANIELVIRKGEVIANNTLCLYRGDKNVEVRFILEDNHFVIQQNTFAQLLIKRPNANSIFSDISQIQDNTVVFLITGDMINELDEIGYYDIQIRLFDDNRNARATLPPVMSALEIRNPLIDDSVVGTATVGYATVMASDDEEEDTFLQDGSYNATDWIDGDIISAEKLNKVEDALLVINEKANPPILIAPVLNMTSTGATVIVNDLTTSGTYVLPKRTDGSSWTNLRFQVKTGDGKTLNAILEGYQHFPFVVNVETQTIYLDNLRITYVIGDTADTSSINSETYYLGTKNTKEYTPTGDYNPATKKYVDENKDIELIPYNEELSTSNTLYVDVTTLTAKKWYAITGQLKKFTILVVYYKPANSEERIQICKYTTPYNLRICCSSSTASRVAFYVVSPQNSKYFDVSLNDNPSLVSYTSSLRLVPVTNTAEFTPTEPYNLAHKQYVDDILLTNYYEELFTITQAELDLSNNGSRGIYLDKVKTLNPIDFDKDFIYYAYYQDKTIRLTYSEDFGAFYCHDMDKNGSQAIGLCMYASNGNILLLNSSVQDVKDYKFTGDLVVKKRLRIDPNDVATKEYVDDVVDYVDNKVSNLVDSAPETLDTLHELAQALGDDPNFATTVSTQIGKKVDKVEGKGLSTNDYTTAEKNKLAGIQAGANNVTVYKASQCTTFTSDEGTCTPLAVQKAVGMFPPKAHEHSQYLTQHQDISHLANKSDIPTATSQLANDNGFITIAHQHTVPQPGNCFVNGYSKMTADGVMEVGKYQDWHNTNEETKDYSLRLQLDHSNANTVLLPTASGRLALQSDIDTKITAHANSSRITFRGGVGSTDRYYPLFKLAIDDSTNYGNVILKGRIGGWEQINSAVYDITLLNRSSARDGKTITAMVSMQGDHAQSYQRADIVIYRQDDNSAIVYLKANGYALWDFEFTLYQHTRLYDESYVTTPTGELVWQLSTAPKIHLSSTGTFSVGSSPSELKELATKEYVDNKAISGGGGSDGTDHNHDDRYYTESEANSRYYRGGRSTYDVDTSYDAYLYMTANGTNTPCDAPYGVCLSLPYRQMTGNKKPDFGGQIFIPNGDDEINPNSMFYRTSLGDTWNKWQEVNTRQTKIFTLPATAGWYRIAEAPVGNVNGRVKLKAENGNYACCSILDAVITKNKYPSLIPVAHSIYSSNSLTITQARIAYVSGSATEKSYLEVYVSPNVALTMTVTSENSDWQLIDPIAVETSPSGYGLFSTTLSYNINGYAKHDHTHHKVTAMSFDSSGYLSITIDGVTKRFAPV